MLNEASPPGGLKRTGKSFAFLGCVVIGSSFAGGCAIHSERIAELQRSEARIAQAAQAGAEQLAPRELSAARQKAKLSLRWLAAKDYGPARWLAEQAQVDAELAEVKALVVRAVKVANARRLGPLPTAPPAGI